ncbi:MAG: hypothetical protein H8F28_17740 [Fibrella sp.]|nr:hypothetical protein [Armatimonadota bacterium]
MQQISPKDRPKLIALVVGVVLVVGFGIKTTMDTLASVSGGGGAPKPAATPAVAGVRPDAATTPADTKTETASDTFVLTNADTGNRGRDPFTPVPDSEFAKRSVKVIGLVPPPPPPAPAPMAGGTTNVFGRNTIKTFRQGLAGLDEREKALAALTSEMKEVNKAPVRPEPVVKVLPPPPPPYAVVGVLIGEPGGRDVAILSRNASTDKKFVVAGDALEGGFTVTAIESGGVRVMHPGRRPTTTTIPGSAPVPVGDSTEYYLPKQTTVVPATSVTLPLEAAAAAPKTGVK